MEVVHQLRVGVRRLRVLVRELASLAPAIDAAWVPVLSNTFSLLGEQRDHVAVAAAVRPLLETAGAPLLDWQPPVAADPVAAVRAPDFQATLLAMQALAHAGDEAYAALSNKAVRELVAARLRKLHRQVQRAGARFEQLPVAEQHRARKQLKRLRYLADFTAPLWPMRSWQRCRRRLGVAQDALGLHQDVAVAEEAFRHQAETDPRAWYAAGWLQAHQALTARAAAEALTRLKGVPVFWR
jgi:CHAD domain-containing protein